MGKITVNTPGMLTTIQDAGRYKHQQSGASVSGVMDSFAHRVANILVGNQNVDEATLEITMMGPSLTFQEDAFIAIAGANLNPMVDGKEIRTWESFVISKGSTLEFKGIKNGARAYLGILGGFDVPVVMDSKSTYVRAKIGGYQGRPLKAGDELPYKITNVISSTPQRVAERYIPIYESHMNLRVVLGPQDDYFTQEGIATLFSSTYAISQEFDRMGYRLEGEVIEHKDSADIISDGMVMGAIQVPGKGQPIILMADRQTAGGYTKIGSVISSDLPLVGQGIAGNSIDFQQVSVEEAQKIYLETQQRFKDIRESLVDPRDTSHSQGGTTPTPSQIKASSTSPLAKKAPSVATKQNIEKLRTFTVHVNGESFSAQVEEL